LKNLYYIHSASNELIRVVYVLAAVWHRVKNAELTLLSQSIYYKRSDIQADKCGIPSKFMLVIRLLGVSVLKAGYSRWWALAIFIPLVNLIIIWVFAFARWPVEKT
jgi:hypothetical protein